MQLDMQLDTQLDPQMRGMRVGYLVNQYPKVSHSFIRREIAGVEACGLSVARYSVRSCAEQLVDPLDLEELRKTRILLEQRLGVVAIAVLGLLLLHPLRALRGLKLALALSRRGDRSLLSHLAYWAEACLLLRWCRQDRVKHLHAHFGTNPAAVAMICQALGGPTFSFTVHGPEEFDRAPGLALAQKIEAAAFVVAISSFGRSQLYRLCNAEQWPKIRIVRCGVDGAFLRRSPRPIPTIPRLVCVGRLCEQKGQILLVEAVQELRQGGTVLELVLVGDGPLRGEIEARIDAYSLQDSIHITGWASAEVVQETLLSSKALVLPSFAEGLPVVLMESLGLGRPVLSTYIAGIPELIEPGVNGWLVPAGSVEALTDGLKTLLSRPEAELKRMGRAGHGVVVRQHNAAVEARAIARLFLAQA